MRAAWASAAELPALTGFNHHLSRNLSAISASSGLYAPDRLSADPFPRELLPTDVAFACEPAPDKVLFTWTDPGAGATHRLYFYWLNRSHNTIPQHFVQSALITAETITLSPVPGGHLVLFAAAANVDTHDQYRHAFSYARTLLAPSTFSFDDDFNRADDGLGPDWNTTGDWHILSNRAHPITVAAFITATHPLNPLCTNHHCQAHAYYGHAIEHRPGLLARFVDPGNYYMLELYNFKLYLRKVLAGGWSILDSWDGPVASGALIKLDCTGSNIKGYYNGIERVSAVDPDNATGTATGLIAYGTGAEFDNFDSEGEAP